MIGGSASGLRTPLATMVQGRPLPGVAETGDLTGSALAAGDFDGDGCDDLAVGSPGQDIGRRVDAGQVTLVLGGRAGFGTARTFYQNSNLPGRSRTGDVVSGPSTSRLLKLY